MVLLAAWIAPLLCPVRPHERGPTEAPVDRRPVHHERVLHVTPVVRHHRDDEVLARGPLVERQELHRLRLDDRLLWAVQEGAPRVGRGPGGGPRAGELGSGYGTRPEATPRITRGSTSQCVCSFVTEDFTVNVFPHFLHRRSTTSVVAPGFIHSASFRLIGSLHSLHRGGTSYG